MNFDYTDDQKALKDEARRFLADVSPLSVARGVLDNPAAGHDAALWARIGEQGWCGAAIPEAYGGLGLGYVELCALAEELGRAVAPVPFASSVYLFAEALLIAGTEEQKLELLPQVASGEMIGTLAVSEGPGVLTADRISARFENGVLSGVKLPVTDGMAAEPGGGAGKRRLVSRRPYRAGCHAGVRLDHRSHTRRGPDCLRSGTGFSPPLQGRGRGWGLSGGSCANRYPPPRPLPSREGA